MILKTAAYLLFFTIITFLPIQYVHCSYPKWLLEDERAYSMDEVVGKAKIFFESIEVKDNHVVVIDIDHVALNSSAPYTKYKLENQIYYFFPAIPEILDLYKNLISRNLKIYFLTSRQEDNHHTGYFATYHNLLHAGYTVFEKLICMPSQMKTHLQSLATKNWIVDHNRFVDLCGAWKAIERMSIALRDGKKIIATMDDEPCNLSGACTGCKILIPRITNQLECNESLETAY